MPTIQRPLKTYGTRSYVSEVAAAPGNYDPVLANEVDADLDTVYTAWNNTLAQGILWQISGATLTPTDPTQAVAIPAKNSLVGGGTTVPTKGRIVNPDVVNSGAIFSWNGALNPAGSAWIQDDVTKPTWMLQVGASDQTYLTRIPAGGGTISVVLSVDSSGNVALAGKLVGGAAVGARVTVASPALTITTYNTYVLAVTFPAITTRGGAVLITGNLALTYNQIAAGGLAIVAVALFRGGVQVASGSAQRSAQHGLATVQSVPPLIYCDNPPAGTYTYDLRVYIQSGTSASVTTHGWGDLVVAQELG